MLPKKAIVLAARKKKKKKSNSSEHPVLTELISSEHSSDYYEYISPEEKFTGKRLKWQEIS